MASKLELMRSPPVRLRSRMGWRLCAFGLVCLFAPTSARSQLPYPGAQRQLAAETAAFRIELRDAIEGDADFVHAFDVTLRDDPESFPITIGDPSRSAADLEGSFATMRRVKNIDIVGPARVLVAGVHHLTAHDILYLLDAGRQEVVDRFMGYGFSLSPSQRFMVYEKYWTRAFNSSCTVRYLAYDLLASPLANRTVNTIDPEDPVSVGIPIFPPGASNLPLDNVRISEGARRARRSQWYWLGDTDVVAFADQMAGRDPELVVFDLKEGLENGAVYTAPLLPEWVSGTRCADVSGGLNPEAYVRRIALSEERPEAVEVDIGLATSECVTRVIVLPGLQVDLE